eukprot:Plantae.Rhodophyta-Rhodochaete_pulchella.ctg689.p1 GENE.Plantae.Rhodophyta-Rhodochaete_pulchella.ctg689~~Plantae.Rhodophyta-Rhodochaete_pulchella.ctg689.p1  ORF type:complete len:898 (-),score=168.67 Plantae.Rhodophyta-Rhodochaete_pulchella.ctg689:1252-3945(-)
MGTALPSKEQSMFRNVVKLYETKQYKKALKQADSILRKFPNHGETLAMKGLTLNSLDRKAEAYDLVRTGLKNDLKSHVCWHVYGLLYRSDRDYREASKAYLQALRIDKDNVQILRDLALLQVQIRDFDGFESTRRSLLNLKPAQKNNWIGFALAHHLNGNYATALSVLDAYNGTLVGSSGEGDELYETSELLLYKASIMEESGDFERALQHLEDIHPKVVDKISWREAKARMLVAVGRYSDAEVEWRKLITFNPENNDYHLELHKTVAQLNDAAGPEVFIKLCDELRESYPTSATCRRLPLGLLPLGDKEFMRRLDEYVRMFLVKGIPSLFSDLQPLYSNESKVAAIGDLFEAFEKSLMESGVLPPSGAFAENRLLDSSSVSKGNGVEETEAEDSPSILLWVRYFLAQHYDCTGRIEKGLETLEKAIAHTPTLLDLFLVKARLLSHAGDRGGAVAAADDARRMDLADRYVNSICAKYALRADLVSQAENWISLFTRDGDSGGVQALYDMQCMWYELEAGDSFLRQGLLSGAFKRFKAVDRHFADIVEDQFDFHTYCLRKGTLRAYVDLLRMEDKLRGHEYYCRAAHGMIAVCLQLHDNPRKGDAASMQLEEELANMTVSERKKALSKRKKAKARADQRSSSQGNGIKTAENSRDTDGKTSGMGKKAKGGSGKPPGWMERDPDGKELLETIKNPLAEATKYVVELTRFAEGELETHALAFAVYMRKRKYLLALRAVRRCIALDPDSRQGMQTACELACRATDEALEGMSPAAVTVFKEESKSLLKGVSVEEHVRSYMKKHYLNTRKRVSAGEVLYGLCPEGEGAKSASLQAMSEIGESLDSVEDAEWVLERLRNVNAPKESIDQFLQNCRSKFPRSTRFAGGTPFPRPTDAQEDPGDF